MYEVIITNAENHETSTIIRTADFTEAWASAQQQLVRNDLWSVTIETEGANSMLEVARWEDWGDGMYEVPTIQYQNV